MKYIVIVIDLKQGIPVWMYIVPEEQRFLLGALLLQLNGNKRYAVVHNAFTSSNESSVQQKCREKTERFCKDSFPTLFPITKVLTQEALLQLHQLATNANPKKETTMEPKYLVCIVDRKANRPVWIRECTKKEVDTYDFGFDPDKLMMNTTVVEETQPHLAYEEMDQWLRSTLATLDLTNITQYFKTVLGDCSEAQLVAIVAASIDIVKQYTITVPLAVIPKQGTIPFKGVDKDLYFVDYGRRIFELACARDIPQSLANELAGLKVQQCALDHIDVVTTGTQLQLTLTIRTNRRATLDERGQQTRRALERLGSTVATHFSQCIGLLSVSIPIQRVLNGVACRIINTEQEAWEYGYHVYCLAKQVNDALPQVGRFEDTADTYPVHIAATLRDNNLHLEVDLCVSSEEFSDRRHTKVGDALRNLAKQVQPAIRESCLKIAARTNKEPLAKDVTLVVSTNDEGVIQVITSHPIKQAAVLDYFTEEVASENLFEVDGDHCQVAALIPEIAPEDSPLMQDVLKAIDIKNQPKETRMNNAGHFITIALSPQVIKQIDELFTKEQDHNGQNHTMIRLYQVLAAAEPNMPSIEFLTHAAHHLLIEVGTVCDTDAVCHIYYAACQPLIGRNPNQMSGLEKIYRYFKAILLELREHLANTPIKVDTVEVPLLFPKKMVDFSQSDSTIRVNYGRGTAVVRTPEEMIVELVEIGRMICTSLAQKKCIWNKDINSASSSRVQVTIGYDRTWADCPIVTMQGIDEMSYMQNSNGSVFTWDNAYRYIAEWFLTETEHKTSMLA